MGASASRGASAALAAPRWDELREARGVCAAHRHWRVARPVEALQHRGPRAVANLDAHLEVLGVDAHVLDHLRCDVEVTPA